MSRPLATIAAAGVLAVGALVACGGDDEPAAIRLVTYDSWTDDLSGVLADFTAETGVDVEVVVAGDTGTMVSKAVLTAGNPEGDVMFGVDNTFLSRAVDGDVFAPYEATGLGDVPAELTAAVPGHEATPVDVGDVCVNVDRAWFDEHGQQPPTSFEELADPAYRDQLVVQNPASSSPGLVFMLATIVHFGEDGWRDYWRQLRDNGVEVTDSWTDAYYGPFSGGGDGDRPIVVSYASSPPAEVVFADPPIDAPTTAVVTDTCFRQVEFAGVLRGTEHADEAQELVDFLLSARFQEELPLNLFVYPANGAVALPQVFVDHATVPADPMTMDPAAITANRETWIDEWTDTVLR